MPIQKAQPGFVAQVVFGAQLYRGAAASGLGVLHQRAALFGRAVVRQVAQALRRISAAHRVHHNALDQPLAKGVQAIERIDQVFVFLVVVLALEGGAETDGQQRIELGQVLLRLCALKTVRLINDEHGSDGRQRLHKALGLAKHIKIGLHPAFVDELAVARKRLVGGHHHGNAGCARRSRVDKAPHGFGGVVEDVDVLLVLLGKKRRRGLQAFERALPNRVRRHQHNEFAQLVLAVQAVDGLDESEGFARASFHQHVQVQSGRGGVGHIHRAGAHAVALAHRCQIGLERGRRFAWHIAGVGVDVGWRHKAHIGQHIGNGLYRRRLVGQGGVLELGGHFPILGGVLVVLKSLMASKPTNDRICVMAMALSCLSRSAAAKPW